MYRVRVILKGSASSGWYRPPKGTHSGEEHRAVGSGKAVIEVGEEFELQLMKLSSNNELYEYAADVGWKEWQDNLSAEEIDAYLVYSTKKVKVSMSDYWRHRSDHRRSKKIEEATETIDRTMRENPVEIEVHRAVDIVFYYQELNRMEIGDSFIDKGYISTSLVQQEYWDVQPVIMHIAKGVKVAYLAEMNAEDKRPVLSPRWASEEQELLIHRGATVTKIGMEGTVPIYEVRD